ncbi:hypothetical protein VHA01S_038_00350 [Vibrio halioticoli NBRC 102217]|uniref:Uncharacterized protein n=1 Tax=Vibrio halioticoli NBRC 102217 TaxID=1219072 RepID=V5FEW7_9VIBR|nr:hypothetical protein VHA01S_038_00350 [Vibrio halioticoli NBRC 102217]
MKIKKLYLTPKAAFIQRAFFIGLIVWSLYTTADLWINDFEQPQIVRGRVEIDFYSYISRYICLAVVGVYMLLFVIRVKK